MYLAAKSMQLEISPARDKYLQLEIYISSQRYTYISSYRQTHISSQIDIYLQLEIESQIVSRNLNLQTSSDQRYVSSCKKYAASDISIKIYISSDIYLQQEIDIYLQLDRNISPTRDRHLDCIQKFDFVDIILVQNFQWLKLANQKYSLSSYVFLQRTIEI